MRIGFGYDLHRLGSGRKLMIGGVHIPSEFGEIAHSDGDVLIHAIIDALFGALAIGDIGSHFPPSDDKWKDINSLILLKKSYQIIKNKGYLIGNMDCTLILERPKILPYVNEIQTSLSHALDITTDQISIKGKTKEKVDAVGKGEAIESYVSLLLNRINNSK